MSGGRAARHSRAALCALLSFPLFTGCGAQPNGKPGASPVDDAIEIPARLDRLHLRGQRAERGEAPRVGLTFEVKGAGRCLSALRAALREPLSPEKPEA
ncbi:MAG: hypothetical protein VYD19_09445, partial [Myxococcota bacterium]|nr:hypothetical protein [Myxococcota bacterium]